MLVNKMVDCFLENGGVYFDTAYIYRAGTDLSEVIFRKSVAKRHSRQSFMIADKVHAWLANCYDDYQKIFSTSLDRCGVDSFDYYMLHNMYTESYEHAVKTGGFDFLRYCRQSGQCTNIGVSFHGTPELLDKILTEHSYLDFVYLQINYLDWNNDAIQSSKCYDIALRHNKRIIVMEPLKGGILAKIPTEARNLFKTYNPNADPASYALRFAASLENVEITLSGMNSLEMLINNANVLRKAVPLNDKENEIIGQAVKIINNAVSIPCTKCRYCVTHCPAKIGIPQYFDLYNQNHMADGDGPGRHSLRNYYTNLFLEYGKISDCIKCRRCEKECPQHLAIVDSLCEVQRFFEDDYYQTSKKSNNISKQSEPILKRLHRKILKPVLIKQDEVLFKQDKILGNQDEIIKKLNYILQNSH